MLKTLIFDLGKTIVPFDLQRGFQAISAFGNSGVEEIAARVRNTDLVRQFESGGIEPRDFVRAMNTHLGMDVSFEQFSGAWTAIFLPETLIPEAFLAALHERYRLLLLSNTNAIHFEMVAEAYPLLRHFDEFILSYKVGAMKPDPAIYQAALEKAQCSPEECFFTDDIVEYVKAAKALGIDAVQFQGFEDLQSELRQRGVSVEAGDGNPER